jgi:hypothetical protein
VNFELIFKVILSGFVAFIIAAFSAKLIIACAKILKKEKKLRFDK